MRYRRLRVEGGTYFFTLVTFCRAPLLRDPAIASLFYQVMGHVRRNHPFILDAHVVMPDHVHLLITLPVDDSEFATRLMLIKAGFTRRYLAGKSQAQGYRREQRRERAVWQGRYWEHLITDNAEFDAIADYIHPKNRSSLPWPRIFEAAAQLFGVPAEVTPVPSAGAAHAAGGRATTI